MSDTVREALRRLVAEVGGLAAFERETREAIGHTNWAVLQLRRAEAEHALREDRGTEPVALPDVWVELEPRPHNGWSALGGVSLAPVPDADWHRYVPVRR